jgi:signal transduction histidine kinase
VQKYQKLTFKFLVPILIALVLVGFAINFLISKSVEQTLLNQVSAQIVDFVQLQAARHDITASDFETVNKTGNKHFTRLSKEVTTKDVIRIKAWDLNESVVFSDEKDLIGKNFGANAALKKALESGNASIEIAKPTAAENVKERQYNEFLEIYVPIMDNGPKSVGVVEIYYKFNGVSETIHKTQQTLALILFGSLGVLAVIISLLLAIFIIRPINLLQAATAKIAKGDLSQPVKLSSKDEFGDLGRSFNHMLSGLQRLQQLKNEFVFIAAHEIRNPVTAIKGYLSLIKEDPKKQEQYLSELDRANKQLLQLTDDLLEIAKADAGKLSFNAHPVNIADAIEETIQRFGPAAENKGVTVQYEKEPQSLLIYADSNRLNEVIINLISNGIKYGNRGGYIRISHSITNGELHTEFEDNGMGISEEAKKHLFQKFYRSPEALATSEKGTGLGLYITKELVKRMGGNITFKSQLNEGSTFMISFRLRKHK